MTPLQRAFAKSRLLKRGISELLEETEPELTAGTRLFLQGLYCHNLAYTPEPKIKQYLFMFMQCDDITAADRQEIKELLQLSQTALTDEQTEQLQNILF